MPETTDRHVSIAISTVRDGAGKILGDAMVGMYLYGSLALGDFDPERSDIDFVIVTQDILSDATITGLENMHTALWEQEIPGADKLEGAYIPRAAIRAHQSDSPPCLMLNEKQFFFAPIENDWIINRHILYEYGITIFGPSPKELIDPVSVDQLRAAVINEFEERWRPFAEDPELFNLPHYQPFVVLTMCRALYTYVNGEVEGKALSTKWALRTLPKEWTDLIGAAAVWKDGEPSGDIPKTQAFIRYAMKQAGIDL